MSQNAIALIAGRVFGAIAAIGVAVIAARSLSEADFGTYAAVVLGGFLANTVATFGTDTLIVRATSRGEGNEAVRQSLGLQIAIVTLLGVLAAAVFALAGERAWPILVQAAGLVAGIWATAATAVLRGRERMDLAAISTSVGAATAFVLAAMVGSTDGTVVRFVLAVVAGQVVTAGLAVGLATHAVAGLGWQRSWVPQFVRSVWSDAVPFASMVAAGAVAASTGLLSLKLLGSDTGAGHYAAANRVAEGLMLVPAAVFGAAFPAMSRGIHLTARYRSAVRMLTVGLCVVALVTIVLADVLVDIAFGRFEPSADILRILALGFLPAFMRTRYSFELIAAGGERPTAVLAFVGAGLSLLLAAIAAATWGPNAVAVGVVAAMTAHTAMLWDLHRRTTVTTIGT